MQFGETGEGYVYLRDRSRGVDVTIYEHQLAAILKGHHVGEVFDPATEVHHRIPFRRFNLPEFVEVVDLETHDEIHDWSGTRNGLKADTERELRGEDMVESEP